MPDVVVARHAARRRRRIPRWPTSCAATPRPAATPIVFVASTHRGVSHRAEARRRFAPAEYLPTPLDRRGDSRRGWRSWPPRAARTPTPDAELALAPNTEPDVTPAAKELGCAIRPSSASAATSSAAPSTLAADADDAELQGTLKRTPFARLLQRLYAKRATGSLLLLRARGRPRRSSSSSTAIRCRCARTCSARRWGSILLEKSLITSEVARRIGRAHAEGEAPPGRDPRRDGGAVAVQPGTRAGRAGRGEAVRGVLVERRQVHVQGRRRAPPETAARSSARPRRRSWRASGGTTTRRASRRRWRSTRSQYVGAERRIRCCGCRT